MKNIRNGKWQGDQGEGKKIRNGLSQEGERGSGDAVNRK